MDRQGFLRLGAFGTAALAAGTGCGEEALPPAPYEGTPAFRTLGRTGMKITIVSMGAMRTSEPAIFQAAFERGSTILTRRAATWTDATRGWWAKRSKATATACTWPPKVKPGSKEAMIRSIDESLSSLKVDYVDLLQLHALSSAEQVMNTEYREVLARQEVGKDAVHRRDPRIQRA